MCEGTHEEKVKTKINPFYYDDIKFVIKGNESECLTVGELCEEQLRELANVINEVLVLTWGK